MDIHNYVYNELCNAFSKDAEPLNRFAPLPVGKNDPKLAEKPLTLGERVSRIWLDVDGQPSQFDVRYKRFWKPLKLFIREPTCEYRVRVFPHDKALNQKALGQSNKDYFGGRGLTLGAALNQALNKFTSNTKS